MSCVNESIGTWGVDFVKVQVTKRKYRLPTECGLVCPHLYPGVEAELAEAVSARRQHGVLQHAAADAAQQVLVHRRREPTHREPHRTRGVSLSSSLFFFVRAISGCLHRENHHFVWTACLWGRTNLKKRPALVFFQDHLTNQPANTGREGDLQEVRLFHARCP